MIELRTITDDNFDACIALAPHEKQKNFVASNLYSIAQAYVALSNKSCIPMPYAIYQEETMVGFLMLSYHQATDQEEAMYQVWRLMIGQQYQGRGYGKLAMHKAMALILSFPFGPANLVALSYEPENHIAKALYATLGFQETGEIEEGEAVAIFRTPASI